VSKTAPLLAVAGLVAASACVSLQRSPEARYFVLRPLAEPDSVPATGEETLLGVLQARIPDALDRPQIVALAAPGELRVDPLRRWAEPLDEGVTRTLAENLGALLPRHRMLRSPWPASAPLRARLAVELSAFGPQADGGVRLEGRFTILQPRDERALVRRTFALLRPPAAGGEAATVESMSALLADLARQVATAVEALPAPVAPPG
jgi:uncharacterized lipoprotein YmbA